MGKGGQGVAGVRGAFQGPKIGRVGVHGRSSRETARRRIPSTHSPTGPAPVVSHRWPPLAPSATPSHPPLASLCWQVQRSIPSNFLSPGRPLGMVRIPGPAHPLAKEPL